MTIKKPKSQIPAKKKYQYIPRFGKRAESRMVAHQIKAFTHNFEEIWKGFRLYTVRRCDRDYQKGNIVRIFEYDPGRDLIMERAMDVIIVQVRFSQEDKPGAHNAVLGIGKGFCIFDFEILSLWRKEELDPDEIPFWNPNRPEALR